MHLNFEKVRPGVWDAAVLRPYRAVVNVRGRNNREAYLLGLLREVLRGDPSATLAGLAEDDTFIFAAATVRLAKAAVIFEQEKAAA